METNAATKPWGNQATKKQMRGPMVDPEPLVPALLGFRKKCVPHWSSRVALFPNGFCTIDTVGKCSPLPFYAASVSTCGSLWYVPYWSPQNVFWATRFCLRPCEASGERAGFIPDQKPKHPEGQAKQPNQQQRKRLPSAGRGCLYAWTETACLLAEQERQLEHVGSRGTRLRPRVGETRAFAPSRTRAPA